MICVGRLMLLAALAVACAREPAEVIREVPVPEVGGGANAGSRASAGGAFLALGGTSNMIGSRSIGPQLTEATHSGYQQPQCFDCHGPVVVYPHVDVAYRPPDCVACHGHNGAPQRDHAVIGNPGCANCHSAVTHVPTFVAPADCVNCHGAS